MLIRVLCCALMIPICGVALAADAPTTLPVLASRPDPSKVVVFDVNRPWMSAADWDGNTPPAVYGMQVMREPRGWAYPRFTLVDANTNSLWVYRPGTPINLGQYPIVS